MKAHPTDADAYAEALGNVARMSDLEEEISRKRAELSILRKKPINAIDMAAANKDASLIKSAISELERSKSAIKVEATPAAVSHHQQAVAEVSAKVAALQRHRAELTARLESDPAPSPSEHLKREREDILADLAMGEPREADLASIDARIRAAEDEAAPALAQAAAAASADRQTLAGIDRRLIAADDDLRRLRRDAPVLLGNMLVTEMYELAERYEDAAAQAAALLLRINALDRIRQKNAAVVGNGMNFSHFGLACFPTPLAEQASQNFSSIIGYGGEHINAAINAETDRLRSQGVAIK